MIAKTRTIVFPGKGQRGSRNPRTFDGADTAGPSLIKTR
jgi:hypothetical protein